MERLGYREFSTAVFKNAEEFKHWDKSVSVKLSNNETLNILTSMFKNKNASESTRHTLQFIIERKSYIPKIIFSVDTSYTHNAIIESGRNEIIYCDIPQFSGEQIVGFKRIQGQGPMYTNKLLPMITKYYNQIQLFMEPNSVVYGLESHYIMEKIQKQSILMHG